MHPPAPAVPPQRPVAPSSSVGRTVALLTALAGHEGPATVQALAESCGLAQSTTHRMLHLLVESGAAAYDPELHRYSVGPGLYRIAALATRNRTVLDQVRPVLAQIVERVGETALFAEYAPSAGTVSFVARADSEQLLQYRIDLENPASVLIGASGRAVAAYLPEDTVSQARLRLREQPGTTVPDAAALAAELAEIRGRGYAVSEGEKLPEARGIAAPVFGPRGVIGSLAVTTPKQREAARPPAEIGAALAELAAGLSLALGACAD